MTETTIGIEIELPWPTMLRRVDGEAAEILENSKGFWGLSETEHARVQRGFDLLDEAYKRPVEAMYGDRIARGNDGFAEFALRPRHDYEDLAETTSELYAQGILVPGEQYPLHVTLGNIPLTRSSWLILMAMELSGGTTSERITQQGTWDRKGVAGILPRQPGELKLGAKEGFEMRSLVVQNLEKLQQTLRIAQRAGNLMVARACGDATANNNVRELYRHLRDSSAAKGIDVTFQWPNPKGNMSPWEQVAGALADQEWQASVEKGVLDSLYGSDFF